MASTVQQALLRGLLDKGPGGSVLQGISDARKVEGQRLQNVGAEQRIGAFDEQQELERLQVETGIEQRGRTIDIQEEKARRDFVANQRKVLKEATDQERLDNVRVARILQTQTPQQAFDAGVIDQDDFDFASNLSPDQLKNRTQGILAANDELEKEKPITRKRTLTPQETVQAGFQPGSVVQEAPDGTFNVVQKAPPTPKEAPVDKSADTRKIKLADTFQGIKDIADETIFVIDQIVKKDEKGNIVRHPGLDAAVGVFDASTPSFFADTREFELLLAQLQGKSFLAAFQSLKGGGQITELEGLKAEQAQARLNAAQSEETFIDAVLEMRDLLEGRVEKARQRTKSVLSGNELDDAEARLRAEGLL